jgi:DNA polymerase III epsilon subunit-like protein
MTLQTAQFPYEPFTSIDLETTGLDPVVHKILEIGAAFYDGKHLEPKTTLECIVIPNGAMKLGKDFNISGQAIAIAMNTGLINEIVEAFKQREKDLAKANKLADADASKSIVVHDLHYEPLRTAKGVLILEEDAACDYLCKWLSHLLYTESLEKKHILAGKNLANLDIPFIKEMIGDRQYNELISFRTLDLTSMFAPYVRQTKSLSFINKLRGLTEVSHRALQDARETGDAIIDLYQANNELPKHWKSLG